MKKKKPVDLKVSPDAVDGDCNALDADPGQAAHPHHGHAHETGSSTGGTDSGGSHHSCSSHSCGGHSCGGGH